MPGLALRDPLDRGGEPALSRPIALRFTNPLDVFPLTAGRELLELRGPPDVNVDA